MSGVNGFEVKLHGLNITVSMSYNYLGVLMDKSLSYKEYTEKVLKKQTQELSFCPT